MVFRKHMSHILERGVTKSGFRRELMSSFSKVVDVDRARRWAICYDLLLQKHRNDIKLNKYALSAGTFMSSGIAADFVFKKIQYS